MNISEIIKELRLEKNISQKKLADAIGVSQKAIDFWERGVNEPKASYIVKLADYFEVSADYILGRNNFFS
ncbi:MAG: helix-turn-helix domain-containing protein [Clostridia bacterium]|nr:helix-turn-helix domain-containing protein [Clostridia bacterium]